MKKIILSLFIITALPVCVFAGIIPTKIYGCSTQKISTAELKAGNVLSFHSLDKYDITDAISVENGSVIKVKVKEYIAPKRGKRDGYAKVVLSEYTVPSKENKTVSILSKDIEGNLKLSTPKDKKEIAKHVGVAATGYFLQIPGFSQAIAVSKGLVDPNPNQSRLESAGTNLYNSTPLTYTEKGKDLVIPADAIVVISIKE